MVKTLTSAIIKWYIMHTIKVIIHSNYTQRESILFIQNIHLGYFYMSELNNAGNLTSMHNCEVWYFYLKTHVSQRKKKGMSKNIIEISAPMSDFFSL